MFDRDRNLSRPDEEALAKGKQPYAQTTGPSAPGFSNPRNMFANDLGKQPGAKQFYQQAFSREDADAAQQGYDFLSTQYGPSFKDPTNQALASQFLAGYSQGVQRGLIPQDQAVTPETHAYLQSQQPGQAPGLSMDKQVNVASRMSRSAGTKTS